MSKEYKPHSNGGGLVAVTASVDDTAYVAPDAIVMDSARVLGDARILDRAVVGGEALVMDNARVSDDAQVYGVVRHRGRVQDFALVGKFAVVQDDAVIAGAASVERGGASFLDRELMERLQNPKRAWAFVKDSARVDGDARVYGGRIVGSAHVTDNAHCYHAIIQDNASVSCDAIVCGARIAGRAVVRDEAQVVMVGHVDDDVEEIFGGPHHHRYTVQIDELDLEYQDGIDDMPHYSYLGKMKSSDPKVAAVIGDALELGSVRDDASVCDQARVWAFAQITGKAGLDGDAVVMGCARVHNVNLGWDSVVCGMSVVSELRDDELVQVVPDDAFEEAL